MIPREGGTPAAGHTKLLCNHTTTTTLEDPRYTKGTGGRAGGSRETPEGPEGTREDPRDIRGTGRHKGDPRDTRGTGEDTGKSERAVSFKARGI